MSGKARRQLAPRKHEVVVIALANAGGVSSSVETEDVAVQSFELAPDAFSWRKYKDQIDLDSVRVSLTDARKKEHGALVAGSVKEGWHLTPAGVEWLKGKGEAIKTSLKGSSPIKRPQARLETLHPASEASRVRSSMAFQLWSAGREVEPRMAAAAFRIDALTADRDRNLKLNRLGEIAQILEDQELQLFLNDMTPLVLHGFDKRAHRPARDGR